MNVRIWPIVLKNSVEGASEQSFRSDEVATEVGDDGAADGESIATLLRVSPRGVPPDHLLRRIDVFTAAALADLRHKLAEHYSHTGRPSIDPELLIRMLLLGYCYGIRSERRLCEEVEDRLTFRWFCRLDLDDQVPDHSTFSKNRHGRFRDSDVLRHIFERVVLAPVSRQVSSAGRALPSTRALSRPTPTRAARYPAPSGPKSAIRRRRTTP